MQGTLLAGKYRVDQVLGQGGMGLVVAATHIHLHQQVALKFLHGELARDPSVVERFVREARASAQLRGEHVCRVSDVGALEDGSPYIVMELLAGYDLSTLLGTNGPLPIYAIVDYMLQACMGVGEAHALGIVHRDLKPANLFLTRRPDGSGLIKVLDFGIAKAQSETNFSLTQTSAVLGSPGYMSPEQLRSSRDVDVRSDIWSFGVIMYELVSGMRPFDGASITELALKVAMDPTPPMPIALPPGFKAVIDRCLEKDPAKRFGDLAALAEALVPFGPAQAREQAAGVARVLNVSLRGSVRPGSAPVIATAPTTPTTLGSAVSAIHATGAEPPRRRWGLIAGVAGVLVLGAGAAIIIPSLGRGGPQAAAPPRETVPSPELPAETKPGETKPETKTDATGTTTTDSTKATETKTGSTPAGSTTTDSTPAGSTTTDSTKTGSTTKPAETKPGSTTTGSAKPAETETGSAKTGSTTTNSTKPAESKTGTTKPAETKTGTAKPAETKTGSTKATTRPTTKPTTKPKPPDEDLGGSRL